MSETPRYRRARRATALPDPKTAPLAAALHPGDTIAIVAPSSPPRKPERLLRGLAQLEDAGFALAWEPDTLSPRGYLASGDAERSEAFNRALRRTDVKALFCVRGGFGALRLLNQLDYAAARRHKKILVGFSDITALHLALHHKAGWRGLSGPMVVEWAEFSAEARAQCLSLARGALPEPIEGLRPLRPGCAAGVLLGGNLSMVARLVGTPYLPSMDGALLFLEEVGEAPYRIDALFAQLRLSGILDRIGGLLLGGFDGWEPKHDHPVLTQEQIFMDYFHDAPYPIATGLPYGHFPDRATMPVGAPSRLEVTREEASLAVLEPVAA